MKTIASHRARSHVVEPNRNQQIISSQEKKRAENLSSRNPNSSSPQTVRGYKSHRRKQFQPHQQSVGKLNLGRPPTNFKDAMQRWLPANSNVFLFQLIEVIYLIVGIVHFSQTRDTSMLTTLLTYAAAYTGVNEITPFIPTIKRGKKN